MTRVFVQGEEVKNLDDYVKAVQISPQSNTIRFWIPTNRMVYIDILIRCDYCRKLTGLGVCDHCGGLNL